MNYEVTIQIQEVLTVKGSELRLRDETARIYYVEYEKKMKDKGSQPLIILRLVKVYDYQCPLILLPLPATTIEYFSAH